MKLRHVGSAALGVLVVIVAATAPKADELGLRDRPQIRIAATGSVLAEPDQATISVAVVTEDDRAKAALDANSATMAKVIAGLKKAGLADRDLATTAVDLQPRYRRLTNASSGTRTIAGYVARNALQIDVRDITAFGDVLDLAVSLGANEFNGVTFGVSKADALRDEARGIAVQRARARAALYAKAAGITLGRVLAISESVVQQRFGAVTLSRTSRASAVPIARGQRSVAVKVEMVFAID